MPYVYVPGNPAGPATGQPYIYQPAGPQDQLGQLRAAQAQQFATVPAMAPAVPPAAGGGGIIWVQGEESAKAYMVAPGASVMLMDSEATTFYIKSVDASGMPLPLRVFDYSERGQNGHTRQEATEAPRTPASSKGYDYATKDEIDELRAKMEAVEAKLNERSNNRPRKENNDGQKSAVQPA